MELIQAIQHIQDESNPNSDLYSVNWYFENIHDGKILIEGDFTAQDLEAIARIMRES